jgi:hypothetical protein
MNDFPDIAPAFAWDGGRRLAFAVAGAPDDAVLTLIAHGPESSSCIAIWEAAAGCGIAILPDHALHLDLQVAAPDGRSASFAIELDDQLAPAIADPGQDGLRYAVYDMARPMLALASDPPQSGLASLNLVVTTGASDRRKVGPLTDLANDVNVTTAHIETIDGGLTVRLTCPAEQTPVLVALIPADTAMLAGLGPDITGTGGEDAAARGFSLLQLQLTNGEATLALLSVSEGDHFIFLAPRHHRLRLPQVRKPGTRLKLDVGPGGDVLADLTVHAYRPATSTALAALSGGRSLSTSLGAESTGDLVEDLASVAGAFWRRNRQERAQPTLHLAERAETMAGRDAHPRARLTIAANAHIDAGVSPLIAAAGALLQLPPALVEEIDALAASEGAALAAWAATAPQTAASAGKARIILPDPMFAGPAAAETVAAAATDDLAARLAEVADRIAPLAVDAERRAEVAVLRELADPQRAEWAALSTIAAALATLKANPPPAGQAASAERLLRELKADAAQWTDAQREARTVDLAVIAERRALISAAAAKTDMPRETVQDIEAGLAGFSADEVVLLHRHVTGAGRRHDLIQNVRNAILALDDAANSRSLASRMDRSGDPLIGMSRIGGASESAVSALVRIPQARDALVALTTWIGANVPPPPEQTELADRLQRNLKSYGCFLLMHAVVAECRKILEPMTESAAALASRLHSGLAETLPRFAAAAAAKAGEDIRLGLKFTDRLPARGGKAGS